MDFIMEYFNGSESSDSGPPQNIEENKTSKWADIFSLFGPVLFLLDIALDIRTAVGLYNQKNYFSLAILVVLLISSTVLVNIYSWIWYNDKKFDGAKTKLEKVLKPWFTVLHFFTLGILIRHLAAASISLKNLRSKNPPAGNEEGTTNQGDSATPCFSPEISSHDEPELEKTTPYLWYNLRTLQIIESYTESAPQIVLMFTITLRDECWILNYYTGAKILVSVVSIIYSEFKYYEPVLEKTSCSLIQVIPYLSWKLPLLASRLSALALFASVEPCFIFTHFICSWLVLFFVATCSQTELMEKGGRGEWLFRATLGVMWYFTWFSGGVKGQTGKRMWLYHFCMLLDIILLSGLWYWRMISDPPHFELSPLKVLILTVSVAILSQIGAMNRAVHLTILQNVADERDEKQEKLFELDDSDSPCDPKRMMILCKHFC
ncbi:XK-related protein 8 [Fundulus heteroclitus]|uniref:XK-related protein 8 n=1 Tax=Fundulus heteroclitus TaxID=8078 RepID=UPI00165B5746|nr:XK-related protein 8 [Fundulus heteroclitus]